MISFPLRVLPFLALSLFFAGGLALRLDAAKFEPLAAFTAGPLNPDRGGLLRHTDGYLYGVSPNGGLYASGTLFRVDSQGQITVLVHFTGFAGVAKGVGPRGNLVADDQGIIWGTTLGGGASNVGTVFRFNPAAPTVGIVTVAEFTGNGGAVKGAAPFAGLTSDGRGYLWGTTSGGGASGGGTVYKIHAVSGVLATVAEFANNGVNGALLGRNPVAALVRDGLGHLWGSTRQAGTGIYGTLFKIDYYTDTPTTVVQFTGLTGTARGSDPQAALVLGPDGLLWGTTFTGGIHDTGTIFNLNPGGGALKTMFEFPTVKGGQFPYAGLVRAAPGELWGTTSNGGNLGGGVVYKIAIDTGDYSPLVELGGAYGATPSAALTDDGQGGVWGTCNLSGVASGGSLFRVDLATLALRSYPLTAALPPMSGKTPSGGLVSGPDGLFWGTTQRGGALSQGSIFKFDAATGVVTSVAEFTGATGTSPGFVPTAGLVRDANGDLWGTTSGGGNANGTVFRFAPASGSLRTMATFTGGTGIAKGRTPLGALTRAPDGSLWGTTFEGGAGNLGTVFKINPPSPTDLSATIITVVEFTGTGGAFPGQGPQAALRDDGAGCFWSTTTNGGTNSNGTIFRYKRDPAPGENPFLSLPFTGAAGAQPGRLPYAGLVPDGLGWLWGTTAFGGASDGGTLFRINIADQNPNKFRSLSLIGSPRADILNDGHGHLWVTTNGGGAGNFGTYFRVTVPVPDPFFSGEPGSYNPGSATWVIDKFTAFTDLGISFPGSAPGSNGLTLGSDGHLYGATTSGGVTPAGLPGGYGQLFRIRLGPTGLATLPADAIGVTTATLHGEVNPNGGIIDTDFEVSTDPSFATSFVCAAGGGNFSSLLPIAASVTGLSSNTTYYYRLLAKGDEHNDTQMGTSLSFTTLHTDYDYFIEAAFTAGEQLDPLVSGPAADPDGDGATNLLEYVAVTDPRDSSSRPASSLQTVVAAAPAPEIGSANYLEFTFHQRQHLTDATCQVEVSSELVHWNEGPAHVSISAPVPDANGLTESVTARVLAPLGTPPRTFVRLRVTRH